MFRDFFAPVPWSPWSRFRGWFFRSLSLPFRRPALKIYYLINWLFRSKVIKKTASFLLSSGLIFSTLVLFITYIFQ